MEIRSIWSDTFYEKYIIEDYLDFRIELDDAIIYRGRAYRYPDRDGIKININKICQNYLNSDISQIVEEEVEGYGHEDIPIDNCIKEFKLYEGDNQEPSQTWYFINNWDYTTKSLDDTLTNINLNVFINGHYAMGMIPFETRYDKANRLALVTTIERGLDNPYNITACGDYALYFQNVLGGWNSFLIEGTVTKKDSYVNHGYCKSFNNNTIEFDEKTYNSEVFTNYTCVTGWLNDKESEDFVKNIGNSTTLYLHDLKENKIFPVLITDTSFTYKTYQNQGKKLVNYTFNLKASQCKIRL